jgi:hypothetical protein
MKSKSATRGCQRSSRMSAQRVALVRLGVDEVCIFVDDGMTGANRARPGLREALAAVRRRDTLVVTSWRRSSEHELGQQGRQRATHTGCARLAVGYRATVSCRRRGAGGATASGVAVRKTCPHPSSRSGASYGRLVPDSVRSYRGAHAHRQYVRRSRRPAEVRNSGSPESVATPLPQIRGITRVRAGAQSLVARSSARTRCLDRLFGEKSQVKRQRNGNICAASKQSETHSSRSD